MVRKSLYTYIFILLFVGWAFSASSTGAYPYHNSYFVAINDIELHFRHWKPEHDDGHTRMHCLLLHGFSGSTFSWDGFADSLHRLGFEVVALDIPPFGYSDKSPRTNQSVTARAMLVHSFLEAVFPGQAWHVTGHSMGGGIAQALVLKYPDTFIGVCFVAPTLFTTTRARNDIDPSLGSDVDVRRTSMLSAWPLRPIAGRLAERFFITRRRIGRLLESAYGQQPEPHQMEGYLRPLLIPGTAAAILASARHSREVSTLDAADLTVPATAIWGENDTWVPHASRVQALEMMPDVRVYLIEGAGHNPMETHLEAFMEVWLKND
jgi:2-hydroxy-6-oxonona-2,4-dienedioate hydrolase